LNILVNSPGAVAGGAGGTDFAGGSGVGDWNMLVNSPGPAAGGAAGRDGSFFDSIGGFSKTCT
jgi:hypothetical protein